MSQCNFNKDRHEVFTGNMFNESHPRHAFTNFTKIPVESKKKKKIKQEIKIKVNSFIPIGCIIILNYQLLSLDKWEGSVW